MKGKKMLKKTINLMLTVSLLNISSFAGNDLSNLAYDFQEELQNRSRTQTHQPQSEKLTTKECIAIGAALTGAAVLAVGVIGAVATTAYIIESSEDKTLTKKDSSSSSVIVEDYNDSSDEEVYTRSNFSPKKLKVTKYVEKSFPSHHWFLEHTGEDPVINLGNYEERRQQDDFQSQKIDLHPTRTKNPRQMLRQEIYNYQKAYHLSLILDNKIHIITGTGKQRPGPNYVLQHQVQNWLKENYLRKRVAKYWMPQEGIYTIILRKNILKN